MQLCKKLIFCLLLQSHVFLAYSWGQEKYLHFTEIDGLPRNIVTCITQDKYGYVWIGTGNGIARFDGKNFYTYDQLKSVGILSLLIDSGNNLWVGADKGLYLYNRITNSFELKVSGYIPKIQEDDGEIYFMQFGSIDKIVNSTHKSVYVDNYLADFCFTKEGIWFGKSNDGVKLLSRESGLKEIAVSYLIDKSVTVVKQIDDKLFFGCSDGQIYVKLPNSKIKQIEIEIDNHHYFKKIVKVRNEIWLATDGNGIIVLDENLHYVRSLKKNTKQSSLNSNSIYDILSGSNSEIWIASYGAGLTCILPDNQLFTNILPEKGNENSLISNEGTAVFVKSPFFYFGTNYGLSIWNENTNIFKNLSTEKLSRELHGIKVTAMCPDDKNNIWIGTYDGLLGKYNTEFNLIKSFHPSTNNPDQMQQIFLLHNVNNTNLLIVTLHQNRFLLNLSIKDETINVFELYSKGSKMTFYLLNSIRENQQGDLLALISDKGLFYVNVKENVLENSMPEMNKRIGGSLSDFYQDKQGNYWLTSNTEGLIRISSDGKVYNRWTTKEGLPTNTLIRIESVDDKFLWISTIAGLSRFEMRTGSVINFNHHDGLPANEFLERISAKTNDGRIIFGSVAGFTIVNPKKVPLDTSKTDVIISDITVQNQSIRKTEGKQYFTSPLEETREITLPFSMNSFTIHFFVKGKSFLQNNNYLYRLTGLEKNWLYLGETNLTTYTNLSPGTYTFEIKSSNKSNTDLNNTTKLIIHITPPWYLSWYAYIIYVVLLFSLVYLSFYGYTKRLQLKKEKEISDYKIQKEHELTEKKLAFFTNISHDLKTPLTLIDAPVSDLLQSKNLNHDQVDKLMIIQRNSRNLYRLITDLLDFRKITQKQFSLEVKEIDISEILFNAQEAFKNECTTKSIEFKLAVQKNLLGYIDLKKIEKVIWNLLSNAIKFTDKGGTVFLGAEEIAIDSKRYLQLKVSDKGIGIAEEDKSKIFDRFFQVRKFKSINQEGTGIGLSIVKDLVEIHHGAISVESALGSGTKFTITIPLGKDDYTEEEFAQFDDNVIQNDDTEHQDNPEIEPRIEHKQKQYNLPILLVVEDNKELRGYLCGHFEKSYKVYNAIDGFDGLKQAKEIIPDIILTDVLMPNMNGYKFCKEIRNHFDTSHIPVLMLTANNTIEQQIEGLSTGADAYITKPFDIKILDTILYTTLENRRKLRDKFLRADSVENLGKTIPSRDIDFMVELKTFIEENMSDNKLDIDLLKSHFALSRTQLNRKIKSLLDITPNNLIKTIRLKKAYKLIHEEGMRVSEAAYQTGFSDPNYFAHCFKKEFGENPSQVR